MNEVPGGADLGQVTLVQEQDDVDVTSEFIGHNRFPQRQGAFQPSHMKVLQTHNRGSSGGRETTSARTWSNVEIGDKNMVAFTGKFDEWAYRSGWARRTEGAHACR
jgi:hypothetical protein